MVHTPTRGSLLLVTFLAWAALSGPALAKDSELNAQGFKAYEKGDTKKAHALFEKALKENPDNAYARLNRARTGTLLNQGKEESGDFDYCDHGSNWIFLALADLSRAVELNPSLLARIDEDAKGLKALKARGEYMNWRKAVGLLVSEKGAVQKALRDKRDWLFVMPSQLPVIVSLQPDKKLTESAMGGEERTVGTWSPKPEGVEITPAKGKPMLWKAGAGKYYFNQGEDFFFELHLTPPQTDSALPEGWLMGPLKAGPLLGDCE